MHSNKVKGFTLVEIIVVLVIIAILVASSLPALTGYIQDSKEKAAFAEVRTYRVAAQAIATELYGRGCSDGVIERYLDSGQRDTDSGSVPADYNSTVASLTGESRYKDYDILYSILFARDSIEIKYLLMQAENGLYVLYEDGKMSASKGPGMN